MERSLVVGAVCCFTAVMVKLYSLGRGCLFPTNLGKPFDFLHALGLAADVTDASPHQSIVHTGKPIGFYLAAIARPVSFYFTAIARPGSFYLDLLSCSPHHFSSKSVAHKHIEFIKIWSCYCPTKSVFPDLQECISRPMSSSQRHVFWYPTNIVTNKLKQTLILIMIQSRIQYNCILPSRQQEPSQRPLLIVQTLLPTVEDFHLSWDKERLR